MKVSMIIGVMLFAHGSCLLASEWFVNEFNDEFWFDEAAYGNGTWVVVGGLGIRYSSDALVWHRVDEANTLDDRFKGITFAGGYFVASGNSYDTVGEGHIAFSNDGIHWHTTEKPEVYNNLVNRHDKIVFNDGNWVAAGANLLHSNNLNDWTEVLNEGGTTLAYGNGRFVFVSWYGSR